MLLYDFGIAAYTAAIKAVAPWKPKARKWVEGRRGIFERLQATVGASDKPVVWIHASSLGEFEQGRPVIEAIHEQYPQYRVLLTFFSPSGYEIRKDFAAADWVFYLPADTPRNVRRFLDIVRPAMAIFVKYDYWLNYLSELRRRKIRSYIFSSLFRRNSIFFKPYGGMFRRALETFETIFVQNEESKQLLSEIGFENVIVAGDTRFDRAAALPAQASRYPLIEHFKGEGRLFIVGSSWRPDEDLLVPFVNAHPDVKFVIAPHEMEQPRIERLETECTGGVVRYSECRTESDVEGARVLIIDVIGILNQLYQYADWVYIGGGFGVCIHNTQEPATYGVPIAFGPKYHKFKEACDMIALGACCSVTTTEELEEWFAPLKADEKRRAHFARIAADYITANKGATELIVRTIFGR
ncbi:MAG: 3-deoxy-D-manno-octulosonic acid transferase [Rikenellaceae bacterium]|nr:3-deoxy-D-manno-octulosonic acid transferase [Rikenellaceae bacterium]